MLDSEEHKLKTIGNIIGFAAMGIFGFIYYTIFSDMFEGLKFYLLTISATFFTTFIVLTPVSMIAKAMELLETTPLDLLVAWTVFPVMVAFLIIGLLL